MNINTTNNHKQSQIWKVPTNQRVLLFTPLTLENRILSCQLLGYLFTDDEPLLIILSVLIDLVPGFQLARIGGL